MMIKAHFKRMRITSACWIIVSFSVFFEFTIFETTEDHKDGIASNKIDEYTRQWS